MTAGACEKSEPAPVEISNSDMPAFSISVETASETLLVNNESLSDLPAYEVEATSTNSYGTEETRVYSGYSIKDVLSAAGIDEDDVESVTATAGDGYEITCDWETAMRDITLLALLCDGKADGGPWLAPCASENTPDYVKGLSKIEVKTAE
jgi:DMSO/TMAO reductase YedYZ molybdopterin-dependent catalytic subunit